MSVTTRSRRASRPQRVPPPLTRGPERFDGLGILEEFRDDLGLLLWQSVRNVLIWAATPAAERAVLFAGGAARTRAQHLARVAVPGELQAPFSVFVSLLDNPAVVDEGRLVNACRRVALWAEERSALHTALDFAQAAALVRPESAALAFGVGRLARRRAEYDRAESWYTRAVVQGRQTRDWRSYALAFSGLGLLQMQRGAYPAARKSHLRCLRAARRQGLTDLQAMAYHSLFAVEVETGTGAAADEFAHQALQAYAPHDRNVPRLAYDVAFHWTLRGQFARALPVAAGLRPHFPRPAERLMVDGLTARAAGGAGDAATHAEAASRVLVAMAEERVPFTAAAALLGVMHGAASLGRWSEAEEAARAALRIAREREEAHAAAEAESGLEFVRSRRRTEEREAERAMERADVVAQGFVAALARVGSA
jgi:tetratricopeptide (TPR) repeat protein